MLQLHLYAFYGVNSQNSPQIVAANHNLKLTNQIQQQHPSTKQHESNKVLHLPLNYIGNYDIPPTCSLQTTLLSDLSFFLVLQVNFRLK